MSALAFGLIVLGCLFGGTLIGMVLAARLPSHHLNHESRESIKLGIGLVATMTALVLGLITASAKGFFDAQDTAIKHSSADIFNLDRLLARYGPETKEIRASIRVLTQARLDRLWPEDGAKSATVDPSKSTPEIESIEERINALEPKTESQRWLRTQALASSSGLLKARWLMLSSMSNSVPLPFLAVLILWLTLIFVSFGLFAPRNGTVISVLFICALSVAAAIVLILELNRPLEGLMKVSSDSLRYTLSHLGE